MNLSDYNRLKQQADALRRQADQAAGALAQLRQQCKDRFGVDSLDKLNKLLAKERKGKEALDREAGRMLEEFQERWGQRLEEAS